MKSKNERGGKIILLILALLLAVSYGIAGENDYQAERRTGYGNPYLVR